MRTSFTDIKQRIAEKYGEPELSGPIEGTFDLPWCSERDLERLIIRCVHDILREVPQSELETYGKDAFSGGASSFSNGDAFPADVLRIVGITAYDSSSPGRENKGPMEPVSEAGWFQRSQNEDDNYVWSIVGARVRTSSPSIDLDLIHEHNVADLAADKIILPDGSDRDLIDRVVQWLKFSRDMEVGRA